MICYEVGSAEDKERLGICEDYEVLMGPDNFVCVLTEPEDRTWGRDLYDVVNELNKLNLIIIELEREIAGKD